MDGKERRGRESRLADGWQKRKTTAGGRPWTINVVTEATNDPLAFRATVSSTSDRFYDETVNARSLEIAGLCYWPLSDSVADRSEIW